MVAFSLSDRFPLDAGTSRMPAADLWYVAGIVLIGMGMASAAGFGVGLTVAPWLQARSLRRQLGTVAGLLREVTTLTARLEQLATAVERVTGGNESPAAAAASGSKLPSLYEACQRLFAATSSLRETMPAPAARVETAITGPSLSEISGNWLRTPLDPRTQLPGTECFPTNLRWLVESTTSSQVSGALLLVRMNRIDQLDRRFGEAASQQLLQRMSSLILRVIRDADLICQIDRDTLAVLQPQLAHEHARRTADEIRTRIREHRFRLETSDTEVLVTSSLGLTLVLPQDRPELVLDRGRSALDRAVESGRNQLQVDLAGAFNPVSV